MPNQSHITSDFVLKIFRESLATKVTEALTNYAATREYMRERIAAKSRIGQIVGEVQFAATRYLPQDAKAWNLATTEVEMTDFSEGSQATQDLKLFSLESDDIIKVADWKRVGKLDEAKLTRYKNGDQPWLYIEKAKTLAPNADVSFEFRFLVVAFSTSHQPHLHTEEVKLNDAMTIEKRTEYDLQTARIKNYNDMEFYPRNEQHCFAYNSTCAFLRECWRYDDDAKPFRGRLNSPIRSQSMNTTERQCPRLYYYSCAAAEATGDDYHDVGPSGEPAVWGSMFHEGMALVYEEIKNHV